MKPRPGTSAMPGVPSSSPEGAPEWMVSYADMITIMMAFFVVLYASTSTSGTKDKGGKAGQTPQGGKEATYGKLLLEEDLHGPDQADDRMQRVFESLYHRFGPEWTLSNCWGGGPAALRRPTTGRTETTVEATEHRPARRIRGLGKENAAVIFAPKPRENLVAGGRVFFSGDSVELGPAEKQQLDGVVEDLAGKMQRIEIRGHAGRRPAGNSGDPWDLAYGRARAVSAYLVESGIDPKRIRLAVAADHEPLRAANDPLHAGQNSRVEVQLLNEWVRKGPPPSKVEPGAKPVAAPTPASTAAVAALSETTATTPTATDGTTATHGTTAPPAAPEQEATATASPVASGTAAADSPTTTAAPAGTARSVDRPTANPSGSAGAAQP